jgi:hypothetical protein
MACFFIGVVSLGCAGRHFSEACEKDGECDGKLVCKAQADAGICSMTCRNTQDCVPQFGDSAVCETGSGLCVLSCQRQSPTCPQGTECNPILGVCVAGYPADTEWSCDPSTPQSSQCHCTFGPPDGGLHTCLADKGLGSINCCTQHGTASDPSNLNTCDCGLTSNDSYFGVCPSAQFGYPGKEVYACPP